MMQANPVADGIRTKRITHYDKYQMTMPYWKSENSAIVAKSFYLCRYISNKIYVSARYYYIYEVSRPPKLPTLFRRYSSNYTIMVLPNNGDLEKF